MAESSKKLTLFYSLFLATTESAVLGSVKIIARSWIHINSSFHFCPYHSVQNGESAGREVLAVVNSHPGMY